MDGSLFCIKMRASRGSQGEHISGAERIAPAGDIPALAQQLAARALAHPKGSPDSINIKVEALAQGCLHLPCLPARAIACATPAEGLAIAVALLQEAGIARAAEVPALLAQAHDMRGAMLVHAQSLARLDADPRRGVRATCMDALREGGIDPSCADPSKNHYREALVLATKVAHTPGMLAEICISDDPDYVTGYVASRQLGYVRLQTMKERGDARGGRIFFHNGGDVAEALDFLEHTPVLVDSIPPAPCFVTHAVVA